MATPFSAHVPEDVLDEAGAAGVEADHGLVHEHGARAMQEGRAHDEALLHAVREALDQLALPAAELEQVRASRCARASTSAAVHAVEAAVEAEELAGGQLLVDEGPVGDEAERGLGRLRRLARGRGR